MILLKSHGSDTTSALIRISLDGEGSFFKVIINIFDCEEKNGLDLFLNSGIQRSQFLAIVEDIPKSKGNLRHIIENLTLQYVSFYVAFFLKCENALIWFIWVFCKKSLLMV